MTASSAIPLKWYVPFANGDASRVEIPVTSSDATRASQTLGFPPLTMQPPAVGGVPPQGEDFNGAMNQIARIVWWQLNGGSFPYDASFATNSNINGYPNGGRLLSADFLGQWISTADNNQANPDTVGTSWVPGFHYGSTSLSALTGGTVTPTPAQAAKRSITLSGTLTSALVLVLPTWLKDWSITNSTSGAFTTVVKTASGSGVIIPQNGSPTLVTGDGTNIVQPSQNVPTAALPNQTMAFSQNTGLVGSMRNVRMTLTAASATATWTGDEMIVGTSTGLRYAVSGFSVTCNLATVGAGGMDVGSAPVSGDIVVYLFYNPSTGAATAVAKNATAGVQSVIYSGANAPAGYTASALLFAGRTTAASLFFLCGQLNNRVSIQNTTVLSTNTISASAVAQSFATVAPSNALTISGLLSAWSSVAGVSSTADMYSTTTQLGRKSFQLYQETAGQGNLTNYSDVPIVVTSTFYWTSAAGSGTPIFQFSISSYTF